MMKLLSDNANQSSAGIREHRSRVARLLLGVLQSGESVDDVAWQQLDDLPCWVMADSAELETITRRVGIVALAPSLQTCINGELLRHIANSVEIVFLQHVLGTEYQHNSTAYKISTDISCCTTDPLDFIETISHVGASVLVSTITSETLARLVRRLFPYPVEYMDNATANAIVLEVEKICTASEEELAASAAEVAVA